MPRLYSPDFLRTLRNRIPIDEVITDLLHMPVRRTSQLLRFRCPLCENFHTATKQETNLARCFDCRKNFNPIDMVMVVGNYSFPEAVEFLKNRIES